MTPSEFAAFREILGLTTHETARALRTSQRTVRRYESGAAPIPRLGRRDRRARDLRGRRALAQAGGERSSPCRSQSSPG
jgi:hypothetical protein